MLQAAGTVMRCLRLCSERSPSPLHIPPGELGHSGLPLIRTSHPQNSHSSRSIHSTGVNASTEYGHNILVCEFWKVRNVPPRVLSSLEVREANKAIIAPLLSHLRVRCDDLFRLKCIATVCDLCAIEPVDFTCYDVLPFAARVGLRQPF